MREWGHDALAADLLDARHLAGEIAAERLRIGRGYTKVGQQLDVAAMCLSWTAPLPTGYEVKVTRGDFLADVRDGKWRKYLPWTERLYFAVPRGLVDVREVPPECGVLVRGSRGWHSARRPHYRHLDAEARLTFVTSLLFRHYPTTWDGPHRLATNVDDAVAGPCARCGHRKSSHHGHYCAGDDGRFNHCDADCHEFVPADAAALAGG